MARAEKAPARGGNPALAALARDAALTRISRTRRWLVVGAAALTAALAALASALLPGKSLGAKRAFTPPVSRVASNPSATPQLPAPAGPGQLGLGSGDGSASQASPQSAPQPAPAPQPVPASAPAASSGGAVVVSGGS